MYNERQEEQRYGRNKDTVINRSYIESGEYRSKFDAISSNKELNRLVYQLAKEMLFHRSGTLLEDMCWIDIDTLKIVALERNQKQEGKIKYSKTTKKKISKCNNLLTLHTHPNSMPPSIEDFNSALINRYQVCIVCCHDGKVFMYNSNNHVISFFYKGVVSKYKIKGYNEYEAQIKALEEFQNNNSITFKEVLA